MASEAKMMRLDHGVAVDRISNLPVNLIELILQRLPVHDAARTTILSKHWRNIWPMHPQLVFDEVFFSRLVPEKVDHTQLYEVSRTISNILLVRSGPILKFHLSIPRNLLLSLSLEKDDWIEHISNKGVRVLEFFNKPPLPYRMPSYLFSCLELTHLKLSNCVLSPPLGFGGFSNLISVVLFHVEITADMSFGTQLKSLGLIFCNGIKHLGSQYEYNNNLHTLTIIYSGEIDGRWFQCTKMVQTLALGSTGEANCRNNFINLDKLVGSMPRIRSLTLTGTFLKCLEPSAAISKRLITTMENLIHIDLTLVGFHDLVQIQYVLCLIRSSPKLQRLYIRTEPKVKNSDGMDLMMLSVEQYLQSPNFADMILDQLVSLNMQKPRSRAELQFIKLLLASSPKLRWIKFSKSTTSDYPNEELMLLPRASPAAQIIWLNY